MKTVLRSLALAAVLVYSATEVLAQARPFEPPPARRAGQAGGALTPPSTAAPAAIVATYLRGQGRDVALLRSIVEVNRSTRRGITQARLEQRAAGLPVHGTYARAAFNARGELVHLVENFVRVGAVARARISAAQAIDIAVRNLYPELRSVPPGFFRSAPTAAAVAVPMDGGLAAGFVVETWTDARNQLHETLVAGDGTILDVESRTSSDAYNVFRINPLATPQQLIVGPGAGNLQSPAGWLFAGVQGSTDIRGNNVAAYLDAASDNESDAPGTAIANGEFTTVADLTVSPSEQANRDVAVQNLFFLNNLIHDELFTHGFVEGTGNFQEDNFGNGGRGSDSVDAEAQDGGGIDNANFATPRDGRNPRMQMYLWSGLGTHQVTVGSNTFPAQGAAFGPPLDTTGVNGIIALVNDGAGASPNDACEALAPGSFNGMIALADRGACNFTLKVKNAQDAGAVAVIIANNSGGDFIFTMGGEDATVTIPSVMISQNDRPILAAMAPVAGTVAQSAETPLSRDGDVDADVVFHEYCHGLTWRMIGRMSGPLAGAIGEGMGDTCAMLLNGDDVIGEYSSSNPVGIRRFRYAGYPNTYSDVTGASVHDDGEIYGATMWRLMELFGEQRRPVLFGYLVDGMNYTPAQPTYEAMRDGILAAVAAAPDDAADECRVWQAFAQFGIGVGAQGQARGSRVAITESFAVPTACAAP